MIFLTFRPNVETYGDILWNTVIPTYHVGMDLNNVMWDRINF